MQAATAEPELTTQITLIDFHKKMKREEESCECAGLRTHYQYLLLALRKIIESRGPTPEYQEWVNRA